MLKVNIISSRCLDVIGSSVSELPKVSTLGHLKAMSPGQAIQRNVLQLADALHSPYLRLPLDLSIFGAKIQTGRVTHNNNFLEVKSKIAISSECLSAGVILCIKITFFTFFLHLSQYVLILDITIKLYFFSVDDKRRSMLRCRQGGDGGRI